MKKSVILFCTVTLLLAACNKPYDPIGRNKPSPVLLINPLEQAFDGDGGTKASSISTNASQIVVGDLPDWVISADIPEDLSSISVKVKPQTESIIPRRASLPLYCSSGDNSITQYIRLFQAGKGCEMAYASFTGKQYPEGWKAEDPSKVSIGNGYINIRSEGVPGYVYTCDKAFNPSAVKYWCSVDMRMTGEGGLKLYLSDTYPDQQLEIYIGYNSAVNRGGIWVKHGNTWCAMDDGSIGSGSCDNQYGEMIPIPPAEERDDWWRLEVFTTDTAPNEPVVQVAVLKTFNGEVRRIGSAYSRKFELANSLTGKTALWGRSSETQFRHFVLSYQK